MIPRCLASDRSLSVGLAKSSIRHVELLTDNQLFYLMSGIEVLTDLPTLLGPDSSTIPIPSHSFKTWSRRGNPHPLNRGTGDLPISSSYASFPSTILGPVRRIHSSMRSSRSSSDRPGSKLMSVVRGVYMRFSVVLIPADSGP
jgi:hypothetical protein